MMRNTQHTGDKVKKSKIINQQYAEVALNALKPHPMNPRRGDVAEISKSIAHNGFYGALVVQRSTGHILAGNHRYLAAKEQGMASLPVIWVEVGEAEAQRILLADNRTSDLGDYDNEQLAALLDGLAQGDGLDGTGYEQSDLDALLAELTPSDSFDATGGITEDVDEDVTPDKAEELRVKWNVQLGQLWQLGGHRIICGDSTDPLVARRVLGDAKPALMVTDPPYGVEYDADWRNNAMRADGSPSNGRAIGTVQNDDRASWQDAYRNFTGDVVYCWHASRHASTVEADLVALGFEIRAQIIWGKNQIAISRGHYHWQHEPCWYAVRKGKTATWQGDRKQTTLWAIDKPRKSETGHSTQKPVECMARPIINHTVEGDVIFEPFSGSGTTIVACEQLRRKCCAIELHPPYVAVAIQRWADLTGGEPELIDE